MPMDIQVFPDPAGLARGAADHIERFLSNRAGAATLALAGGNTPAATYEELAGRSLDWSDVTLWLGDERWVPHDHPDSNTRMVRELLVDRILARFFAPETGFGEPDEAAAAYEATLAPVLQAAAGSGLVLLGMGDDGHTASLFPGSAALEIDRPGYVANWVSAKDTWRLTATKSLLWQAAETVFLVQGEAKAAVLAEIIDEGHPYPAQQVATGAARVRWLLDAAAASRLRAIPR
jgi:6-phosphogluconolactonase